MMDLIKKIINKLRGKSLDKPIINPCIFKHKWSDDKAKQICLNKGCNATRILMYNKNPKINEPALSWHYYNIDELNFK